MFTKKIVINVINLCKDLQVCEHTHNTTQHKTHTHTHTEKEREDT